MSAKNIATAGAALLLFLLTSCGGSSGPTGPTVDFSSRTVVAFGNSITTGVGDTGGGPQGYPFRLEQLLKADFPDALVINRGSAGERTTQGARRILTVLNQDAPDFMLILEGVNDIADGSSSWAAGISANLESMVKSVRAAGATPLIATLTPTFGPRAFKTNSINITNDMIRDLAEREDIVLVDLHEAFSAEADPSSFFDSDGLHPNGAGYDIIAEAFYRGLLQAEP